MWESIQEKWLRGTIIVSDRLMTPQGWIVRTVVFDELSRSSTAVFHTEVTDPEHQWKLQGKDDVPSISTPSTTSKIF